MNGDSEQHSLRGEVLGRTATRAKFEEAVMGVQSFRDSIAWQKAMELSAMVYRATPSFPKEEMFGLTNQLRRASVSIASNIAEGQGRLTSGEFAHFLGMARGSALEVETQLEIARMLAFGRAAEIEQAQHAANELGKILNAVLSKVKQRASGR